MKSTIAKTIATLATVATLATTVFSQPLLRTISPSQGPRGTVVTISGTKFNTNTDGRAWNRTLARNWKLYYNNGTRTWGTLSFTYLNSTTLRATIPSNMVTSKLALSDGRTYVKYSTNQFTVQQNQNSGLKFTNSTQYALVELKLNGQRLFNVGQYITPRGYATFNVAPGTYQLDATLGTVSNNVITPWFQDHATVTITNGQVESLEWTRISLGELFGSFTPNHWQRFNGYYFDNNSNYHTATLWINNNQSYELYDGSTYVGGGSLVETNWPDYSSIVNFKLGANGAQAYSNYPFATIYAQCGPTSWRWIEFTKQ